MCDKYFRKFGFVGIPAEAVVAGEVYGTFQEAKAAEQKRW